MKRNIPVVHKCSVVSNQSGLAVLESSFKALFIARFQLYLELPLPLSQKISLVVALVTSMKLRWQPLYYYTLYLGLPMARSPPRNPSSCYPWIRKFGLILHDLARCLIARGSDVIAKLLGDHSLTNSKCDPYKKMCGCDRNL